MTNPFALDTPAPAPAQATATATTSAPAAQPGADPFDNPAPQEPRGPRLREMYGRLLLVVPHKLEEGLVSRQFRNPDGSTVVQDRLTVDVVILDGGTIHYGGKPEKTPPVPHTKTAETPMAIKRMYVSSVGLISQCRVALAKKVTTGQPGMVLGRLAKGEDSGKGEPPWVLTPPTDADKQIARQYLANVDPFA